MAGLASVGLVLLVACVDALPLQDFPAHCAATQVAAGGANSALELTPGLHQTGGYYALAALMAPVFGAAGANRLLLAVALGGLPLSVWAYAAALGRRGRLALVVVVGSALGLPVAMGFLPWVLALTLCFAVAALVLRVTPGAASAPHVTHSWATNPTAQRVALGAAGAVLGTLLYWVHGLAPVVLAGLLAAGTRRWREVLVVVPATILPVLILPALAGPALTSGDSGLHGLVWESPLHRLGEVPGLLGMLTPGRLDDGLAMLLLGLLLALVAPNPRTPLGLVGLVAVAGCLLLPDTVDTPRIIRFATRFLLPALALLALSERPVGLWVGRLERLALGVAALLAAVSATVLWLDGETLAARHASLSSATAGWEGARLGVVTLSRPEVGTLSGVYSGLHAPRMLDAAGRASSVGPFFHERSPVRLRPSLWPAVALATHDTLAYVAALAPQVDAIVGDFGDEPPILAALGALGWQDCRAFAAQEPRWRLWAPRCEGHLPHTASLTLGSASP